jgi:hypothetical protein
VATPPAARGRPHTASRPASSTRRAAAIGPGWAGGRSEETIDAELVRLTGITGDGLPALRSVLAAHEELDTDIAGDLRRVRPYCRIAMLSNVGFGWSPCWVRNPRWLPSARH